MKSRILPSFLSGILMTAAVCYAATPPAQDKKPQEDKVITICADYWHPFNGTAGSDAPGYIVEIAETIFKKAGYRVDYQTMPWERAIDMTRAGEFNAIVGAFKTDVPDFVFPDAEMGIAETVFLVRKETAWRYTGVDSLPLVKIGIAKGYGYGQRMDDYVRANADNSTRIEVLYGEDVVARNLHKLAMGRIDAVVDVRAVFEYTIAKEGMEGKFIEAGTISTDKVYIAFSPRQSDSKKYAEILSNGILELRSSGELERILFKYGCKDWGKNES